MLFKGKYAFLSNFTFVPKGIKYDEIIFPTVENAYQAAKCKNKKDMEQFAHISPEKAKKLGRTVVIRDDWDKHIEQTDMTVKEVIMYELLSQKFQNKDLANKLIETGDIYIAEDNYWHDNFWGICNCPNCSANFDLKNQNHLGRLLMKIRSEIKSKEK